MARRPAFPRKLWPARADGYGAASSRPTGRVTRNPWCIRAARGVFGALLHGLAFGLDPMKDKGLEGVDTFQTDRVARAVEEAEKHLPAMKDAILRA